MKPWTSPPLPADLLPALGLNRFSAIDVETTGLDPQTERMIEVSAVRFENGLETERFSSLLACSFRLPPNIVKLTGISDEMLKGQPSEASALRDLMNFIGGDPIVGQNISFDLSFLQKALRRLKKTSLLVKKKVVDTALLARVLLPTLPSKGLSSLAKYFNLDQSIAHRAAADARRAGQVLLCLLTYFPKVDIKSVDLLRRITDGMRDPSAWIFAAWADYLIQTSSVEGRFQEHRLPYLTDNILGKLPAPASLAAAEAQAEEEIAFQSVSTDEIAAYFETDSPLKNIFPHYERRPEQREMAAAVTDVLNGGGLLTVEAGTGVGKSMAYLIPAAYWARANRETGERVIISTNTKNLQQQLFNKDLPALSEVLPFPFSAVLLKGRNNYLCRRRWENLSTAHPIRLPDFEKTALLSLVLWSQQTRTGDVSEVGGLKGRGALWARLGSEAGSCRGKRCRERHHCFHNRIRNAAARAHIVVVNHALLMADIAADRIPIGSYRTLIADEAHHLERAAAQHLGKDLNSWMFRSWTSRMYDAEGLPTGLVAQILLGIGSAREDHPSLPGLTAALERTSEDISSLSTTSDSFFEKLTTQARSLSAEQNTYYSQKVRLRQPDQFLEGLQEPEERLDIKISAALDHFKTIMASLNDIPLTVLPQIEDWLDDLRGAYEELSDNLETLKFFQSPADDNWVYWMEIPQREDADVALHAAPLNAGDILRQHLFDPLRTGVMTSATLTVADRFHYFLRKVGLHNTARVRTLQLGSPFDFERQMLIGAPAFLPSPKHPEFEPKSIALIRGLIENLSYGTLGLFTSYKMLQSVSRALGEHHLQQHLLIQGQSGSRDHLLRRFREEPGSVLLGTDSFWEGIDVVGEALELLLVTKLPFEVPSEPLVEARWEKLRSEGKDPFMYYTVPEAVIRLRQGVGRLIRSKTDRGVVLILDSRLTGSRYAAAFTASLPTQLRIFQSPEQIVTAVKNFLEEKTASTEKS